MRIFRAHKLTVHTLAQITASSSMQPVLSSPFDGLWREPGSLHLQPNAWRVSTGSTLFLFHAGSLGVFFSIFLTSPSLGWDLIAVPHEQKS